MAAASIHASAVVDPSAAIGDGASIGAFTIVGPGVEIGEGTRIGPHCSVTGPTRIGRDNHVHGHAAFLIGGGALREGHAELVECVLRAGGGNLEGVVEGTHEGDSGAAEEDERGQPGTQNRLAVPVAPLTDGIQPS